MSQNSQFDLFERAGISDALSRDIALARGQFIELPGLRFVRIDASGVKLLEKRLVADRVTTYERGIAALPIMPIAALQFMGDYYVRLFYASIDGRTCERVVPVQGLINNRRNTGVRKALESDGYIINDEQWAKLGPVMRDILKQGNLDGSLHVDVARPRDWKRDGVCLVARAKTLDLRVIMGGKAA